MPVTYLRKGVQPVTCGCNFYLHKGIIVIVECRSATESGELPWTLHWMQRGLCCHVHYRVLCLATWLHGHLIA